MTQQVDVMVKLTLEVNAKLSKSDIESELNGILVDNLLSVNSEDVDVLTEHTEIINIKEEAEIYGNDESLSFSLKENGDANSYSILKHDNWIMSIQVNGQLHSEEQISLMQAFVDCLNNGKASY